MADRMQFEHVPNWEKLPAGWRHLDVDGVTVDGQDRVYAITRYDERDTLCINRRAHWPL